MDENKVVLVAPDRSGQLLLALPLAGVRADLVTLATLLYASTFGEVRRDDFAERLLNTSLDTWAERLRDEDPELADLEVEEVLALKAADSSPFPQAEEFFGWDWDGWRPEPRLLTALWLQEAAREVLRWLANVDDGWGFDYESSVWLSPEDQPRLVALLHQRGYRTVGIPGLAAVYDDPPRDVDGWLRDALAPQSVVP